MPFIIQKFGPAVLILLAMISPLISPSFADSPGPEANTAIAIRPTGIPLTNDMVTAIADSVAPTVLSRNSYPDAGHFSARQIATIFCGTPDEYYLNLLESRNHLSASDLDTALGDAAFRISFPACLNIKIFSPKLPYVIKLGDSYSTIRQMFTGVQGRPQSNSAFFGVSVQDVVKDVLMPGDKLQIPYETSPTILPASQAQSLVGAISSTDGNQRVENVVQQSAPAEGQIISFTHGQVASTPDDPPECGVGTVHPFSANDVVNAFEFSVTRAQRGNLRAPFSVGVVVVDNGFFGAKENAPGTMPVFSEPQFREGLFDTTTFGTNLGPPMGENSPAVYPLNYQNGLSPTGPLTGHGTHVTGLVLGGPDMMSERNELFGSMGPSWLQVLEINVGDGSDLLLPFSAVELNREIGLLPDSRIINLSISYDGSDPNMKQNFGFMNESYDEQYGLARNLYVAAAGNNSENANDFPAVLGGVDSPDVITVSALDPNGNIAAFSDTGPKVADVAAPGCNIASWIDGRSSPTLLSGTSQAAPQVSFQAALIRGISNASAEAVKKRIIISGDLLTAKDQSKISGHVKINIVNSLYVFDDYIDYLQDNSGPSG